MASRTTVTLVDDLDGNAAHETVPFALDGATYEIDLSSEHAQELRATLERYVAVGRRTGGRRSSPASAPTKTPTPASGSSRTRNQEIRAWANSHGVAVRDRGRIPGTVAAAYDAGDPSSLADREAGPEDTQTTSEPDHPQPQPQSHPEPQPPAHTPSSDAGDVEPEAVEDRRGRDGLTAAEREAIRAWAVNEGIEVKARGQLKKDLIANHEAWSARQS